MDARGVVPLRAGFDVEFRGFRRKQVLEHIDLLEDQLRMIAMDRDEATKLNTNCRKVCDELRTELDEARGRLVRIESSTSGLPQAMQGIQNMLALAEDEGDTIRQRAERYAENVRGSAETDARQIRADAEAAAAALRAECEQTVVGLETRRDRINVEHSKKIDALHSRAQDLRLTLQQEYEQVVGKAKAETEALLAQTRQRCADAERVSEERRTAEQQTFDQGRAAALWELDQNRGQLEEWRKQLIIMLCNSRSAIDASVATVTAHGAALQELAENWLKTENPAKEAKTSDKSTVDNEKSTMDSGRKSPGGPSIPRQQDAGSQHPTDANGGSPAKSSAADEKRSTNRRGGADWGRAAGRARHRNGKETAGSGGSGATGQTDGESAAKDGAPAAEQDKNGAAKPSPLRSTTPIARD